MQQDQGHALYVCDRCLYPCHSRVQVKHAQQDPDKGILLLNTSAGRQAKHDTLYCNKTLLVILQLY